MRGRLGILATVAAALALGGCVSAPVSGGSVDAVGISRPMSDMQPSNESENRARVHVDLGMAYFEVGRYDVALDEGRTALNESQNYAPAFHLMGLVYMMIGENASANDFFSRALNVAPGDPDFNNSYGWFLCQQGREDEALDRFARAARNPYYRYPARPYTNAGLCLEKLNKDVEAEKQFLFAVQADPANGQALYQLAAIAYRRNDFQGAHDQLVRLHQQLRPTAASVWLGLRAARKLGERNAEASYAEQLRSRFADSAELKLMLQGKYE